VDAMKTQTPSKDSKFFQLAILETMERLGGTGVSFAELCRIEGFEGDGQCLGIASKNIWFWFNLSTGAADALEKLIEEKKIEFCPTTPLIYLIDGRIPNVPVAKQNRSYKKDRWLPVALKIVR